MNSFLAKTLVMAGLGAAVVSLALAAPSPGDPCVDALNSTPQTRHEFPKIVQFNKDWVQKLNSSTAREHGWALYEGVVSPAGSGCRPSRVPLWLSWATKFELFKQPLGSRALGRLIRLLPSTTLGMDQTIQTLLSHTGFPASQVDPVDMAKLNPVFPNGPFRMPETGERILFSTAHYNPSAENSGLAQTPGQMQQAYKNVPSQIDDPTPSTAIIVKPIWLPFEKDMASACIPVWNPEAIPNDLGAYGPDHWPEQMKISMKDNVGPNQTGACVPSQSGTARQVPLVSVKEFFSMRIDSRDNADALSVVLPRGSPHVVQAQPDNWVVLVGFHVISKEVKSWSWNTYWWEPKKYREGPLSAGRPKLDPPWSNYVMNSSLDEAANPAAETQGKCDVGAIYNPYQEAALPDQPIDPQLMICGKPRVLGGLASNCRSCHSLASYLPEPIIAIQPTTARLTDYFKKRTRTGFLWSIPNYAYK